MTLKKLKKFIDIYEIAYPLVLVITIEKGFGMEAAEELCAVIFARMVIAMESKTILDYADWLLQTMDEEIEKYHNEKFLC